MSNLSDMAGDADLTSGTSYSFVNDRFDKENSSVYINKGSFQVQAGYYFYGDFTIICWFNAKSVATMIDRILEFGDGTSFVALSLTNRLPIEINGRVQQDSSNMAIVSSIISLNQWYHVAFVVKDITASLFINGIQVASSTDKNFAYYKINIYNYIGRSHSNGFNAMNGTIDELKIYKGALTSSNIYNDFILTSIGMNFTSNFSLK